jgi:hypothetical protein
VAGALRGGLPALLAALLIGAAAPPAPLPVPLPAVPPAEFAAGLAREPARLSAALAPLGRALASPDGALSRRAADYLAAAVRARQRGLAGRGVWTHDDVLVLVTLELVDPERFVADAAFRRRVVALLPRELDPQTPAALRDAQLAELNQVRGFDFAASEEVERAWGAIPRRAAERRLPFAASGQRFDADVAGRLAASVYSLPSFFFDLPAADAFLSAVRAAAPERTLVVLTDSPLREGLAGRAAALHLHLLDTYGRAYSPWPRDPFTLVHSSAGAVRVLVRPNLQPGREEDLNLGPELVRGLPAALDRAWGKPTWSTTPMPFHNGQVLLTPTAAWMTLHALEPRILQLLGLGRVPVESFATAAGIDRYLAAAGRAAGELATLYDRPVRFVHPLPAPPEVKELAARRDLMRQIGGGAGYDLDSIVTFVPLPSAEKTAAKPERLAALVADVAAGRALLAGATAADLDAVRNGYGLEPAGASLAAALAAAQATPAAESLASFLDLVARHLASQGMEVRRLPVLTVPVALLRERTGLSHPSFLLTWNNVVVESPPAGVRAEGFSALLPAGDRAARDAFGALGVHLDLFPPLVRSIVLNGGYRCASNHLRTGR